MILSRIGGRALAGLLLAPILCACNPLYPSTLNPSFNIGLGARPMSESPSASHSAKNIDLLYVTDRAPIVAPDGSWSYGADRSNRISFGSVTVSDAAPTDFPTEGELHLAH
jgi:hypothetical protein